MTTNQKKGLVLAGFVFFAAVLLLLPAMASEKAPNVNAQQLYKTTQTSVMIVGTGSDTQFYPSYLNIRVGDTVAFINQDGTSGGIAHSVLSVDSTSGMANGVFDSGLLHVGNIFKVKFDKIGTYSYIDPTYPNAVGTIIVAT